MRGYITCKHCKGIGKTFKWWIFPKICPYCNGLGDIWVDNIDEYFKSNKTGSNNNTEKEKKQIIEEDKVKDNWEYIQDFIKKLGHFPKDSDELNVLINYVLNKKQKLAWTEEDEKYIFNITHFLEHPTLLGKSNEHIVIEMVNWLKSLKERVSCEVNCTAIKERSKENESRITTICTYLQDYARLSGSESRTIRINEYCDWLKSSRPQLHWKPSDEYYELEEFAKIVRGNLTGISKAVQELFEAKYLQLTGNKMYRGFKD